MTYSELKRIKFFSEREIIFTGSRVKDVKYDLFLALDRYRLLIKRKVLILVNGLTTGVHQEPLHPQGMAADIGFRSIDGDVNVNTLFKCAMDAGFKETGIYWNGNVYSQHLGLSETFKFWSAVKSSPGENHPWQYFGIISDPRDTWLKAFSKGPKGRESV